jgi:cell division protease FtsH
MKSSSRSSNGLRVLLGTLLGLIVIFGVLVYTTFKTPSAGSKLGLERVYQVAAAGQIVQARLLDQDAVVQGTYCPNGVAVQGKCRGGKAADFHATYPRSDVATQQLIDRIGARAPVVVDHQTGKEITKLILTFVLPLVILANLFGLIFLSRGGDASLGEIAGFGRLGRDRQRKKATVTGVGFEDVAGADEAVAEVSEVLDYLKDPSKFQAYGATAPKGLILFGPPGCGKTLLARAVAGEAGVPFVSVSGTEFVESLVGVGAARVRDLFNQVRDLAPAICFIDEIDAVGRRREGEGVSGGEREQTLNQLLVELDGFEVTAGIVVIGATNRPDILDPALMRPGRFDRHVTLAPPDAVGREKILQVHARKRPIAPDVDFASLARRTPGFTGADLANVINEAALLAVRAGQGGYIGPAHLSDAIQRVLHGPHRGTLMTPAERARLATHEAGHAIVAQAAGRGDEVHRVSVLARGPGLATTAVAADSDKVLLTSAQMEASLTAALGGVAAEQLVFGDSATTAADDIARASAVARDMVGLYGMSSELGRMRLLTGVSTFLGDGGGLEGVSEQTLNEFDAEVRRMMKIAEARATEILTDHRKLLDAMAARLAEEETLEGDPLDKFLAQVRPYTPALAATNGHAEASKAPATQ